MRIFLALTLTLLALPAHAATYLLLSQTNNVIAAATNSAKAYTDAHGGGGSSPFTNSNGFVYLSGTTLSNNSPFNIRMRDGSLGIGSNNWQDVGYAGTAYFNSTTMLSDSNEPPAILWELDSLKNLNYDTYGISSIAASSAGSVRMTLEGSIGFGLTSSLQFNAEWPPDNNNPPINMAVGGTNVFTVDYAGNVSAAGTVTAIGHDTTPVTITQDNTNVVVNMAVGVGRYQLLTATNDLYIITSNRVAGAQVLLDITAGTTNRNIAFADASAWMSATPTVVSSNHVMWVSITSTATTTNGLRKSAVQSSP